MMVSNLFYKKKVKKLRKKETLTHIHIAYIYMYCFILMGVGKLKPIDSKFCASENGGLKTNHLFLLVKLPSTTVCLLGEPCPWSYLEHLL